MSPLSTFLDGQDPSQLRGLAWLALSDTGYILAGSAASDSGGGATVTWGTAGTVSCRIDPAGGYNMSRVTGGVIDERSTHVVTVPPGTSVSAASRFAISGRGTFEVTATHEQTSQFASVFEVIALS